MMCFDSLLEVLGDSWPEVGVEETGVGGFDEDEWLLPILTLACVSLRGRTTAARKSPTIGG